MKKKKNQSDYHRNAAASRDVVQKEFQDLSDKLERSKKKCQKWKKRCQGQEDHLKGLEAEVKREKANLEREKKESAQRELHAKIQAHLDAWNFYHEGTTGA